jgi:flavin-dependent dehydrogenase
MPSGRRQFAVAVEIEAPMAVRHFAHDELVFDYSIPGGYAWAFPKGRWWNVGVLSVRPEIAPTLRRRLVRFMDRHGIRPEGGGVAPARVTGRRIPLWSNPLPAVVDGRVALVGDAAGLADPFFGEGIAQALESGRLAAAAVAAMLAGTAPDLTPYANSWATRTGRHLQRMELLSRLVYSAPEASVRLLAAFAPLRRAVAGLTAEPLLHARSRRPP